MVRAFLFTVAAALLVSGVSLAADKGKKKKKKAGNSGEIVKVDAEKGTITLKVKGKKKTFEDKEFKVTDTTTVTVAEGDTKTELKAGKVAELLKKDQFKVGTMATVQADEDGTAKSIVIGSIAKKKKKKKAE